MKTFVKKAAGFAIRIYKSIIEAIKYYVCYPIAMFTYRNRNIYLVSERGTDARDNGYYMYRYIRCKHPELEAYYVINDKSVDFENVACYGNIVQPKTWKHYMLFIAAKYKISTHVMGYAPDTLFYVAFNEKHRIPGKQIFLQHGVIKDNLVGLYQEKTKLDIFICGAEPEYKYICDDFHYRNNEVKYTGLARYDGLHDFETKQQILIMPTWRVFLKNLKRSELCESEYFIQWNEVLNDNRLATCLAEHEMQLVFYPHYEMQPFIECFSSVSERVAIADFEHYDVQTLLKESKLLITDYSSVFFDFAYMKKPCLYFQFDENSFYGCHYKKGYFDYKEMGFGEVLNDKETLVNTLVSYIENSCQMKEIYKKRAECFFPIHDKNNCERIFKEIEAL